MKRGSQVSLPSPRENVSIGHLRAAQVGHVKRAVGFQRLRVAQRDARSRRAGNMQPAPADHVLAHVKNENARPKFLHGNRLERAGDANGFRSFPPKDAARRGNQFRGLPFGIVEIRPRSSRGNSLRASYSSPSYSLFARIGPSAVSFQESSLTISDAEPSV